MGGPPLRGPRPRWGSGREETEPGTLLTWHWACSTAPSPHRVSSHFTGEETGAQKGIRRSSGRAGCEPLCSCVALELGVCGIKEGRVDTEAVGGYCCV